jgi:hypothetical protein
MTRAEDFRRLLISILAVVRLARQRAVLRGLRVQYETLNAHDEKMREAMATRR